MTKNQSLFFRFLLFLAGAGIIILAFFLTKGEKKLSGTDAFVWSSIGIMYLVFFLPFFFSAIKIANFSEKIPVLPLVWLGIVVYLAVSVIVIVLLSLTHIISLKTAIIIQSIAMFLFFVDVYFAYFTSSHVRGVVEEETEKQQYLNQIKSNAQVLSIFINKLPTEFDIVKRILKQSMDEIRYIYPVSNGAGNELETKIKKSLNILSEFCETISLGASPGGFASEAENLKMLVKERKLLRN